MRYGPTSTHRYTTKLITLQFSSRCDKVRVRSARTGRRDAHVHSSCISRPCSRHLAWPLFIPPARIHAAPVLLLTRLHGLLLYSARPLGCSRALSLFRRRYAARFPYQPRGSHCQAAPRPPRVRGTDAHHGIYSGAARRIARDHAAPGSHSPCHHQPLQVDCATLDSKHK